MVENTKASSLNKHFLCGYKIQEWLRWVTHEVAIKLSATAAVVGQNSADSALAHALGRGQL